MFLDYLLVENFMKVKRLELKLDGPGLYFITGAWESPEGLVSSGCGKTTTLNAIRWAIDGQAKKKHIGPHDRGMKSTARFGDSVEIRRLQRTGSPETTFFLNGEDRSSDRGAEMTDKAISELLNFDWDVLRSLYHVKNSGFFYEDDSKRKKLLLQFFDARPLEQITELIGRDLTKLRETVDGLTVQLGGIDGKIAGLKMAVDDLKRRVEEAKKKPVIVPDLEGGRQGLALYRERLELAKNGAARAHEELRVAADTRRVILDQLRQWEGAYAMYFQERGSKDQQLKELQEAVADGVCRACGQELSYESHIQLEINKLQTEIDGIGVAMREAKEELAARREPAAETEQVFAKAQQTHQAALRTLGAAEADVRAREGALKAAERPQEPLWQGLEQTLTSTRDQLAEVMAERMEAAGGLRTAKEELRHADRWAKFCRHDMRVMAFESVADELGAAVRAEARRLFGRSMDARFTVKIPETGPEKFMLEAQDDDEWRDARETSDGQNARLSLATTFALRRRFELPFSLLMLDEPFAHCDAKVVERIMPVLQAEARELQVLIVAHNTSLIPRDAKIIQVVRKGNEIEGYYEGA